MEKIIRHLRGQDLKAQLIRGASASAGIKAVNLILTLTSGVLLARTLGPESYGTYVFVLSIVTLLSLPVKAGLPTLLVRETAKYQLNNDWPRMRGLVNAANLFAIGYAIFVGLAVLAFVLMGYKEASEQTTTLIWALLALPLMALEAVRTGTLKGLRKILSAQAPEQIIRPITMITLLSGVAFFGSELNAVRSVQFNTISAVLALALGTFFLFKAYPIQATNAHSKYEIKLWTASLLPLSLFAGIKLLDSQASILILGLLVTNEEVGLFRVAASGAALVAFGLQAVNMAMAPQIARLYNAGELEKLQRVITLSTRAVALVSFTVAIIFITFGEAIIQMVYGREYIAAAPVLKILCIGQLVNASAGSVALVLNMTGNDKSTVLAAVAALFANLILSLSLVPTFGVIGAAIGFSASLSIWNILLAFMAKKKIGINTFLGAR